MIKKFSDWYKKAFHFVMHDMWHDDTAYYNRRDAFLVKQLKIFTMTFRRFFADKVAIRCSALSFYSLMAIVPSLAVVFGIAKGLGFADVLHTSLEQNFGENNEVFDFLDTFAENAIAKTSTGLMSSLGVVFLLWSVVKVLNNIENAFNDVWQVKRPRPVSRKFADYFAFILIIPIIIAFSSTISLALRYHVGSWTHDIPLLEHVGVLFGTLVPFALVYLALTFIYVAVPYTKVRVGPAFIAAVISGTAFQLVQNMYIFSQITVSKYGAIYGAFAALPLLCIWLQISWTIILFGAELAFAYQNLEHYHYEKTSEQISSFQRKVAGILVARLIAKRFLTSEPPYTIADLTTHLDLPYRVVRNSIEDLQKCNILSEVTMQGKRKSKDGAYQPALDVHRLTIAYVYNALNDTGQSTFIEEETADMQHIVEILSAPLRRFEASDENKLLIDI
jgi:membrane protein